MHANLLLVSLLVAGTMALWPRPAMAQQACGERHVIVASLGEDFGEARRHVVPASLSAFYEFFASERTGSWTLLLSDATGISCVVATGDDWADRASALTADGWPRPGAARVR